MENIIDISITKAEACTLLGLTMRRINQFCQDGTFSTDESKLLPLCDTVRSYIDFIKGRATADEAIAVEQRKLIAETEYKEAKAKRARLEAKEIEGIMHRSEDVEAMTTDLALFTRSALLSLPSRLAVNVSGVTAAEAADIIRREVNAILEELSHYEYDPAKYAERVKERYKLDTQSENEQLSN